MSFSPAISKTGSGSELGAAAGDGVFLGLITAFISLAALFYFVRHQEILLYGDATAHISIARRVFDSRTPGPLQLGTVWLPLPHILMIPFIISTQMWSTGIGASIPSMVAYIAATVGIFRLVYDSLASLSGSGATSGNARSGLMAARVAAWFAALAFALNPNLVYLQATAMTEPLYLALFIWVAVFFNDFVQATRTGGAPDEHRCSRALIRCGWMLLLAMLTRYDGWFAATAFVLAAVLVWWRRSAGRPEARKRGATGFWHSPLRPLVLRLVLIVAIAPVAWFAYNAAVWGNPLEFADGPYSAPAIEARAPRPGGWHYPGWHAPRTAATYFLKAAKLNMAAGQPQRETERARTWRLENLWFPLALIGTIWLLVFARGLWPWLALWVPLPFYVLSIAWGGVPIFVPVWWPYSYYNVRYGLELLPALAVFPAAIVYFAWTRWRLKALGIAATAFVIFVAASYTVAWRAVPVCLREARANNLHRIGLDRAVASVFRRMPPGATVLMSTVNHAAALEFAGFPLRRTINEANNRLWRAALADPAHAADYIVAFQTADDPVWRSVQKHAGELQTLEIISAMDEPRVGIYCRRGP